MGKIYDVLIVGGGPAGAYAAWKLSALGYETLILEKQKFPRYKPCGGGITAKAAGFLTGLDFKTLIEDRIRRVIFTYRYGQPLEVECEQPAISMVMRDKFDHFLLDQAKKQGAQAEEGSHVEKITADTKEIHLKVRDREYKGRVLIGADGALGAVAHDLPFKLSVTKGIALEGELETVPEALRRYRGRVILNHGNIKWGYDWLFPKAELLSLGTGTFKPPVKHIKKHLYEFQNKLALTGSFKVLKGHPLPVLKGKSPVLHHNNALLVGDAAGLVDPFCGEGIHYAFQSATLAAQAVDHYLRGKKNDLSLYTQQVTEQLLPEIHGAARIARVIFSFPAIIHRLVSSNPGILRLLIQVIFGERSYQKFFAYLSERYPIFRIFPTP